MFCQEIFLILHPSKISWSLLTMCYFTSFCSLLIMRFFMGGLEGNGREKHRMLLQSFTFDKHILIPRPLYFHKDTSIACISIMALSIDKFFSLAVFILYCNVAKYPLGNINTSLFKVAVERHG